MNMVLARMIAEEPQRHSADALAQALDAFRCELERVEAASLEALDAFRRELERMEATSLEALRQKMFEGLA